jgi:nucleoside-diphosphate-sugar epimerase
VAVSVLNSAYRAVLREKKMKVLVVGGTGLTGGHAALHLRQLGHDVTLMARTKPQAACLQSFAFIAANYIEDDIPVEPLRGFDWLLFAAGSDLRQLPEGEGDESFFTRANVVAIPRFFDKARQAGIRRAVYIGSYYPQVAPETIETSPYVRSRHLSDEAVRGLNSDCFTVCSLNAPFILGHLEGLHVPHLDALVQYAAGRLEGLPVIAPAGGVNHISSQSMSEAIASAFERGEGGKAYLLGDENLSWKVYLELFCSAAGNPQDLKVSTAEHPVFPDILLYAGRNAVIRYEPDQTDIAYQRNAIKRCIAEVVEAYL